MSSLSLREKSLAYYKCIVKSEYYESGWKYFNTLSLNEPMGDNFVTVHFNGRLGNVFCQLATLIAYAEEFKMNISICQQKEATTREQVCGVVIYPELFAPIYKDVFKGYYEKFFEIFSQFSTEGSLKGCQSHYFSSYHNIPSRIPFKEDYRKGGLALHGLFQNYFLYKKHLDKIRDCMLLPLRDQVEEKKKKYEVDENTILLHVRRGDTLIFSNHMINLKVDYYRRALRRFPIKNKRMLVVSDDIPWCQENLKNLSSNLSFSEETSEKGDFLLLCGGSQYILSNSSFCYWGPLLSTEKNKKIVVPDRWINDKLFVKWAFKGDNIIDRFFPSEWEQVRAH